MTTPDQTRTAADVDPLVLTMPVPAGRRLGALAFDVLPAIILAAAAAVLVAVGQPAIGGILAVATLAWLIVDVTLLARTGQSLGAAAVGTRTVDRTTGVAVGASLIPALFGGRLRTCDLRRGRDPFAPALAPFVFPAPRDASSGPVRPTLRGLAPVVELDSGQRLPLDSALVLGRSPSAPADAPAAVYQWADLSRTLSKSHARLEWDGRLLWVTDLGSTNGTMLQLADDSQPLLAYQRTPIPSDAVLELGDRVVRVRIPA